MPGRVRDWDAEPPLTNGELLRMHREGRKARTGLKQTMRATANLLGLHEDTYGAIEYDSRQLQSEEARMLSNAWRIPVEELYLPGWRAAQAARQEAEERAGADPSILPNEPYRPVSPRLTVPIREIDAPLVGSVRAGPWESPMESNAREPIPADQWAEDVFVSFCVGDSMEGFLQEDDMLVWRLAQGGQVNNDVVYAVNQDNEVTVKQYKEGARGAYLHPLNPEYADLHGVDAGESAVWTVHGILVARNRNAEGGTTLKLHNPKRLRP